MTSRLHHETTGSAPRAHVERRPDLAELGARRTLRALVTWTVIVSLGTAWLIVDRAWAGTPCLLEVTVERGLLTVDSLATPLDELLRTIGQQAGVHVLVDGHLDERGACATSRAPEAALPRLWRRGGDGPAAAAGPPR